MTNLLECVFFILISSKDGSLHQRTRTGESESGFVGEWAWVQVARKAFGPEGRVVLRSTSETLCCDATLVSPFTRAGSPVPSADVREGVALVAARRRKVARYADLTRGGPQRFV